MPGGKENNKKEMRRENHKERRLKAQLSAHCSNCVQKKVIPLFFHISFTVFNFLDKF